jgi:hypothetical protein
VTSSSVARRKAEPAHRRVEGREQHVLGTDRGAGQAVEQRRFPGIGVADQRNDRIGHPAARLAVQGPGALYGVELALQSGDALADQPAVDLELALARPAEKAEPAALALQMGPRPHEPRALIRQRRQLDLQATLMGMGACPKYFEDEAGAVDHLGLPAPLEVALLHRAYRRVDDDEPHFVVGDESAQGLDIAAAEQRRRHRPGDPHDLGANHLELDRPREPDRLVEARLGRASRRLGMAGRSRLCRRMNDQRAAGWRLGRDGSRRGCR